MSDEDSLVDPRETAGADRHGETLLYDFAKFLTTLSLLALGGMLTIIETADRADIKTVNLVAAIACISLGGVIAVSTAQGLVDARAFRKTPPRHLRRYLQGAMGFLGLGMGAFLSMWMDSLL